MAGAVVKVVTLRPPGPEARVGMSLPAAQQAFSFDEGELRAAFTPKTKAILLNTPHNPTGKVFTRAELELIAERRVPTRRGKPRRTGKRRRA